MEIQIVLCCVCAQNSNHQHSWFQAVMPERDTSGGCRTKPCVFVEEWGLAQFFAINLGRKII